ncbi:hypothetical protein [Corynebacterium sputi]|uniref:hypothetical protein n=1 Tax=Corynebacterium sputi TaxID=489915 RepID=UPI0012EB303B|nr:hypothetical protein [Corynebacterium sputi]
MNPGEDLNRPGAFAAPSSAAPAPYFSVPAPPDLTEVSRERGYRGSLWASLSVVLFLCGAIATWGSHRSPGGNATPSLVLGPIAWVMHLSAIVAAVVAAVYVVRTLLALRDRALVWDPPLARGAKSIANAHLRPVLNLTGPVTVLMETGVPKVSRSLGAFAWWGACLALPFALYLGVTAETAAQVIRADIVAALTAAMVSVAGKGLDFVLAPGERRRYFALPGRDSYGTVPFWERGIDSAPVISRTTAMPPLTVDEVMQDPVEKLYIREKDR